MTTARHSTIQAARLLSVSDETVRRRIRSGELKGGRDNHGRMWVELETAATPQGHTPVTTVGHTATEAMVPLSVFERIQDSHREALAAFHERAEKHHGQHRAQLEQVRIEHAQQQEQMRANHLAELARISSTHLDLVGRIQAQASAERGLFLERVDAAELRAEAAEARAAAVDEKLHQILDRLLNHQPPAMTTSDTVPSWWARWFGHTKRSDIAR